MVTVVVETVLTAKISDVILDQAPSFARRVPFSILERPPIC
jgi:hypothetical protein